MYVQVAYRQYNLNIWLSPARLIPGMGRLIATRLFAEHKTERDLSQWASTHHVAITLKRDILHPPARHNCCMGRLIAIRMQHKQSLGSNRLEKHKKQNEQRQWTKPTVSAIILLIVITPEITSHSYNTLMMTPKHTAWRAWSIQSTC